jgi:hypothetical protein
VVLCETACASMSSQVLHVAKPFVPLEAMGKSRAHRHFEALNGPHSGRLRRMKEGPEGRGSSHAPGIAYAWEPLGDDEAMH